MNSRRLSDVRRMLLAQIEEIVAPVSTFAGIFAMPATLMRTLLPIIGRVLVASSWSGADFGDFIVDIYFYCSTEYAKCQYVYGLMAGFEG